MVRYFFTKEVPVRKIVNTQWECGLCGNTHSSPKKARACEQKGIVAPRFRLGDRVLARSGRGKRVQAIVCQIYTRINPLYPHEVAPSYWVCRVHAPQHFKSDPVLRRVMWCSQCYEQDLRDMSGLQPPKRKNARNWREFWEMFGRYDRAAYRVVREHLKKNSLLPEDLFGTPTFR